MKTEIATKFKETEIGTIPEEWDIFNVGKIGRVVTGKTPPTNNQEYYGVSYPFVKIPDMADSVYVTKTDTKISQKGADYLGKAKLPKNSIMVSCIATIGNVGIASEESFTNQQINSLIPDPNIADFKYLYYFFKANKELLESLGGGGSVYTNISKSKFENMPVVLPGTTEQKQIAEILSSLDDKIELNRKINVNLEDLAGSLFKLWFVDFEFPNKNGKPYKSSGGTMIDSELGKIPEEWDIKTIGEISELVTKGTTPTTAGGGFTENGINFIKVESITDDHGFDTSKFSFIDNETNDLLKRSKVKEGDILYTIAGTIGRFALADKQILPANTNQAVAIIRVNKDYVNPYYVRSIFGLKNYREELSAGVVEAVQANLSLTNIRNLKIILPTKSSLTLFDSYIEPLLKTAVSNILQTHQLSLLRDSLLPRLMSGKIRVN